MTPPQSTPLVQRLIDGQGAHWINPESLDAFLALPGEAVLLFWGDPVRFPEGQDVAVVLPELAALVGGPLHLGVVQRECEDAIAAKFNVQRWPSLVWLRDGRYVGVIAGMLDWTDYVERVRQALATAPGRVPGVGIPVVAAGAAAGACH